MSEVFLGSSVKDGQLRFSSVSQIKTFDPNTDGGCNRKWWYQYIDGKKPAKTAALLFGDEQAKTLEHYLKTGEDTLPPILRAAKKFFPAPGSDLDVELPLARDIEKALAIREKLIKFPRILLQQEYQRLVEQLLIEAGLVAADVPIIGKADFRHQRGEFIDEDGIIQKEDADKRVVEIGDLKTVARISPQKILRGESAGTVLPGYAKKTSELATDIQLVGYGKHATLRYPEATHIRLSLIYAQKRTFCGAKRTTLVPVERIKETWATLVEPIVRDMQRVALIKDIASVTPNPSACDAFMHVNEQGVNVKGCPHRYYCPLNESEVVSSMFGSEGQSGKLGKSFFDDDDEEKEAPSVSSEVLSLDDYKARVAEERRLAAIPPPPQGKEYLPVEEILRMAPPPPVIPPPPPSTEDIAKSSVLPPDAPKHTSILTEAMPVPSAVVSNIEDPALREKVTKHAAEHAEQAPIAEKKAVAKWCADSGQRILLSGKSANCPTCGKKFYGSTSSIIVENDLEYVLIPRHKSLQTTKVVELAETALPAIVNSPLSPVTRVFINTVVHREGKMVNFPILQDYYRPFLEEILKEYECISVNDLFYIDGWKQSLREKCRNLVLPSGDYYVFSDFEIANVVLEEFPRVEVIRALR